MLKTMPRIKRRRETKRQLPLIFVIPAILAVLFIFLTFLGLLVNIPWSSLFSLGSEGFITDALGVSLIVSFSAALITGIVGFPLTLFMQKASRWVRQAIRGLVLLPLVLPPVVGGIALLFAFGRKGFIGQWLYKWLDISLPFTIGGAILAATFVALPFFVLSTEVALQKTDPLLEEAARAFGAKSIAVTFRVIFPQILPGVLAGLLLSWARALGEFGATITFAGNLAGETQTLPLALFEALESGRSDEALVISLLLILIATLVLVLLQNRWVPALARNRQSIKKEISNA